MTRKRMVKGTEMGMKMMRMINNNNNYNNNYNDIMITKTMMNSMMSFNKTRINNMSIDNSMRSFMHSSSLTRPQLRMQAPRMRGPGRGPAWPVTSAVSRGLGAMGSSLGECGLLDNFLFVCLCLGSLCLSCCPGLTS